MPTKFKEPMLAPNEVVPFENMAWPMFGSYKFDGMRITVNELREPVTRTLKPIPNDYVRTVMTEAKLPVGVDGELGIMDNNGVMDFRKSMSALTTIDGEPEFRYYVFDNWNYDGSFLARNESLAKMTLPSWVVLAEQRELATVGEAKSMYAEALGLGHEGLILRPDDSPYKMGRATVKQGWMFKFKPKVTAEAYIVDVVQGMKNTNARERDARGYAKRSGALVGKVPVEKIGALVCKWHESAGFPYKGTFEVGGGWDHDTAAEWFANPPVGQIATLEFADTGNYEKPRHAQFKGIRPAVDLSVISEHDL